MYGPILLAAGSLVSDQDEWGIFQVFHCLDSPCSLQGKAIRPSVESGN